MPVIPIQHRAAKSWNKIVITVAPCMSEAVAAYLTHLTNSGLEISASENIGESSRKNQLEHENIIAYLPIDAYADVKKAVAKQLLEIEEFLANLSLIFSECLPPILHSKVIKEEDWGKKWKSFFTSFRVTPSLTIKPSWEERGSKARGEHHVIEMDPGMAFGTGHHASTQLALLLLEEIFTASKYPSIKALDVGTGSGILAMACALFGAREVMAVDNDPGAVETAQQNILRNRLEDRITVSNLAITALKGGFHIVVANITHDILADLAVYLTNTLSPDGFLILSGILIGDQDQSVRKIYANEGLQFIKCLSKDEWTALLFQKKSTL